LSANVMQLMLGVRYDDLYYFQLHDKVEYIS